MAKRGRPRKIVEPVKEVAPIKKVVEKVAEPKKNFWKEVQEFVKEDEMRELNEQETRDPEVFLANQADKFREIK